jgi:transposase InsO family protein
LVTLAAHPTRQPVQNAFVESFIGRFWDECLNQHWFGSLAEAAQVIEAWWQHYNRERPHSALGLDEGPRPSPALAPAAGSCYDLSGSPSSWT